MIGAWGQGLTEDLFSRDVKQKSVCQAAYETELARIAEIAEIAETDPKGFSTYTSKSTQDDRIDEAERRRKLCVATYKQAAEWNKQASAQMAQQGQDALAAAQARLAMQSAPARRGGLSWWLLPLLAVIPLGYFFYRRRR